LHWTKIRHGAGRGRSIWHGRRVRHVFAPGVWVHHAHASRRGREKALERDGVERGSRVRHGRQGHVAEAGSVERWRDAGHGADGHGGVGVEPMVQPARSAYISKKSRTISANGRPPAPRSWLVTGAHRH